MRKEPTSLPMAKQCASDADTLRDASYTQERKPDIEHEIITYENIYKAAMKCKSNVMWKDSVASFCLNAVEKCNVLERQLLDGSYRPRKPVRFYITSPKRREIISTSFRDRVYQRVLNDEYIYPMMTNSFIYDNWACQIGKGTDGARKRVEEFLRKEYRKNKSGDYVLKIDIKGYYPNMRHEYIDGMFRAKMDSNIAERAVKILHDQYQGDVGYNPGSQLVQIAGISALDKLDHYIKERMRVKLYLRYMDDMVLIHSSKDTLKEYLSEIKAQLAEIGFEVSEKKTEIRKLEDGFEFLGFVYRLTKTGKVIKTLTSENVKRERKKLRRAVNLAKKGKLTRAKVDEMYNSWKAHASKGDTYQLIQRMDKFYQELWRQDNEQLLQGKS